jgi:hypothetical protein
MDRGDANWNEVAKDSVLRGLASVMKLRHLSPSSQLLWHVKAQKMCGTKWPALTPRSCILCTDITCQVRLHQWLQRSEDKMPYNVSRNKYQPHRMRSVTVTCAVTSIVCATYCIFMLPCVVTDFLLITNQTHYLSKFILS